MATDHPCTPARRLPPASRAPLPLPGPYLAPTWPRCRDERGAASGPGGPQPTRFLPTGSQGATPPDDGNRPCSGIARDLRPAGRGPRGVQVGRLPFLRRPSNGGNTAWVTTTANKTTRATTSGGIAVDVTLEAGTWRSAFTAAATHRQLAANCAATPAEDAESMHKSGIVIIFISASNRAGWIAVGLLPSRTLEWDRS